MSLCCSIEIPVFYANNVDPNKTPHSEADLGLHCLPITLLVVSRLKWINDRSNPVGHFVICQIKRQNKERAAIEEREIQRRTKKKDNDKAETEEIYK